jgi:hypothetical protein
MGRKHERVFVGRECVDALLANGVCTTRAAAVALGQRLVSLNYVGHIYGVLVAQMLM